MNLKYTIVTVFFSDEIELILLQARSFVRFLNRQLLSNIILIDNSTSPLGRFYILKIFAAYKELASYVKIVPASQIARFKPSSGWESQQYLKLYVAQIIKTERYLILDAKNHLVNFLHRDFLETIDGRATINTYSYINHPLKNYLLNSCTYLNIPLSKDLFFTATVTPFVIYTNQVLELIKFVEGQKESLADQMRTNHLTEFFLYGAWLHKKKIFKDLYFEHQVFCPTIWKDNVSTSAVRRAISNVYKNKLPFFAVHRLSFLHLNYQSVKLLATFWTERGLFNFKDAFLFIWKFKVLCLITKIKSKFRLFYLNFF